MSEKELLYSIDVTINRIEKFEKTRLHCCHKWEYNENCGMKKRCEECGSEERATFYNLENHAKKDVCGKCGSEDFAFNCKKNCNEEKDFILWEDFLLTVKKNKENSLKLEDYFKEADMGSPHNYWAVRLIQLTKHYIPEVMEKENA